MKTVKSAMISGTPTEIITKENLKSAFNLDDRRVGLSRKRLVIHHISDKWWHGFYKKVRSISQRFKTAGKTTALSKLT